MTTKHLWKTWWAFGGIHLPKRAVQIQKNVVLAPLDNAEFQHMKGRRASALNMKLSSNRDLTVVRYPPRDEVECRYKLLIDFEASDEDEALKGAQDIADRLVASLNLVVKDGAYFAEFRKYKRADQKEEYIGWSQSSGIILFDDPIDLGNAELSLAAQLAKTLETDETANNAYVHLLSAWQLQATVGSKPLERSVLQHYVLSIEAIVNGVMSKIRRERGDKIREEERRFAADFANGLLKRADKPQAIRDASTRLREIALTNMLPSIDAIASILKLKPETVEHAKDLYRFRSRSLSHPGRSEKAGFAKWLIGGSKITELCLADRIAREFLHKYSDYAAHQ
ncbi:hypothetical protein [Mesorhizobium sp. B2-7-1]|uniref:hypothetical protein n=1 Tax=Mesorhizobium sp. B2-7-1 TaxID=2589909 RepID=UPI00112A1BD4|nr:hypothetical protein [Mesorhizobium sp. B2-7-1]TPJ40213.1 hypothetical protein FJ471_34080 [Mesorhizobium sp. B2-7-1]